LFDLDFESELGRKKRSTASRRRRGSRAAATVLPRRQADQIVRIFAQWAIAFFGQIILNNKSSP
jgi:hypothetical protein